MSTSSRNMESVVQMIDGSEIGIRASMATPIHYHEFFGRDLFKDIAVLQKTIHERISDRELEKATEGKQTKEQKDEFEAKAVSVFGEMDVRLFAQIAYTMAWQYAKKHGDDFPDDIGDWMDEIPGVFSIYNLINPVFELWARITETGSTPKKKYSRPSGNSTSRNTSSGRSKSASGRK